MSLSHQLRDPASPIRRWMDAAIDRERTARLVRDVNDLLAPVPPLVVDGSDPATVAGALRLALRAMVAQRTLAPGQRLTAAAAAEVAGHAAFQAPRAGARAAAQRHGWEEAPTVAHTLLTIALTTRDDATRARASLALAALARVAREDAVPAALAPAVAQPAAQATHTILARSGMRAVADLGQLLAAARAVWDSVLGADTQLAPQLAGAALVGGCDLDWITGGTLWAMSASAQARPFGREHVLLGLASALIDVYGAAGVGAVGWYFARHRVRHQMPLGELLAALGLPDLARLRERFWEALSPRARPLDPATAAAAAAAPQVLRDALAAAVPEIHEGQAQGAVVVRAAPVSGVWELRPLSGPPCRTAFGWCVAVVLTVAGQPALLVAVPGAKALGWTVPRARAPRDGVLPVVTAPAPLGPRHLSWAALVEGTRRRLTAPPAGAGETGE